MSNKIHRSMSVDCNLPYHFDGLNAPKNKKNKVMEDSYNLLWWHSLSGEEQKKWLITFISHSKITNDVSSEEKQSFSQHFNSDKKKSNKTLRNNRETMVDLNDINTRSQSFYYNDFDLYK